MAYDAPTLNYVTGLLLRRRGEGACGLRILELGAQEVNADVTAVDVLRCVKALNPEFSREDTLIRQLPALKAAAVFKAAGVEYHAADLYASEDTLLWDLNQYEVPLEFRNRFDLVTNLGTSEHVFNQHNVFRLMHDGVAVGGLMTHGVPSTGYYNHGLFKYEPRFFWLLAIANDYEVVQWRVNEPERYFWVPPSAHIPGSDQWQHLGMPGMMITFTLRKRRDAPFVAPTDIDQRFVPSTFTEEAHAGIMQSPAVLDNPFNTNIRYGDHKLFTEMQFGNFERALASLSEACVRHKLGPEPILLAATLNKAQAMAVASESIIEREALETLVSGVATRGDVPDAPDRKITPALGMLGFGWQDAVCVYDRVLKSWRWFGARFPATVYCRLPESVLVGQHSVKVVFHDAKPGDAINYFSLKINDRSIRGHTASRDGQIYWQSEPLPLHAGVTKLTLSCQAQNSEARIAIPEIEFLAAA